MTKIAVLVGSLRAESFSKKIAHNTISLLPEGYKAEIIEIGNLPLYNEEYDENSPEEYITFRNKIREFDAVLFVTPEYNRSVPGILKNALDIGSRPYGESVWDSKPAAIITQSPGRIGAFGANHHLRQSLAFLNMPVVQQPEIYIGESHIILDENGKVKDESVIDLLQSLLDSFLDLINKYQA